MYYSIVQCAYIHICAYKSSVVHILQCRAYIIISCGAYIHTCVCMSIVSCIYYSVVHCVYTHIRVYEYSAVHILKCRAYIIVSCIYCVVQCVYTHIRVYEYSVVHEFYIVYLTRLFREYTRFHDMEWLR